MMRRFLLLLWLMLLPLGLLACGGDDEDDDAGGDAPTATPTLEPTAAPTQVQPTAVGADTDSEGETLILAGPDEAVILMRSLEMAMTAGAGDTNLRIMPGANTDESIQGVLDGRLDMLFMMRAPTEDEPVAFIEFMRTPVAVYANADVEVESLTREQVMGIFSGEITNWSEVGGADRDIVVFVYAEDHPMTYTFRDQLFGDQAFPELAPVLNSVGDAVQSVQGIPGAIVYTNRAGVEVVRAESDEELAITGLALEGVSPDDPDYPVQTSLGIAYLPDQADVIEPILDNTYAFLDTELGRNLLGRYGITVIERDTEQWSRIFG